MHELGIIFHIIERVEEVCRENRLTTVASVTLEIGEVSGAVDSYLTDCWVWAAEKSEFLKGSTLRIEWLPGITLCDCCGKTYRTLDHGKTCPHCSSGDTHLQSGREIMIKEIEAC